MRIRTTRLATLAVAAALTLGGSVAVGSANASTDDHADTKVSARSGLGIVDNASAVANPDGTYTIGWTDRWPGPMHVYASTDVDRFTQIVATSTGTSVRITGLDTTKRWYFNVTPAGPFIGVVVAPRTIGLQSAPNARDIGGYRTNWGLTVKYGQVFRSDAFGKATDADVARLAALGLDEAVDFRTDVETAQNGPNRLPAGVTAKNLPIADGNLTNIINGAVGSKDPVKQQEQLGDGKAAAALETIYKGFVDDPAQRAQFATVLRDLAEGKSVIYNCTAGKDRTGWMTAVILKAVGVDDATIYGDFLATNANLKTRNDATKAGLKAGGLMQNPDLLDPLLYVQKSYLDTAFAQVKVKYGSFDNYLRKGLNIDPITALKLQAQLLTF
ncbi:tyrosine-protein phosphatase [Streptomyces sp. SID3343]|uniref:tyrosine-protein phosphatase n=1 Tax=Streptomyces sp. SID3343 TaxID=2690260 RepID=UPI00136D85A5|nr:tyrosine-protein phosphatase [Streptomyces sp. SID3343]MYW04352.1 protein-tyrosine-phosphatase [Streptomyces sp. SID3343]